MKLVLGIALGLAALCSCSKDKVEESKLRRSGEGPAVVVLGEAVSAAGLSDEVEPNDESAQAIVLGSGIKGILQGSADLDRYSFSLQEPGMVFVSVAGAADADLKLELYDDKAKLLAHSDRGPATTPEGIAGYGLEPGSYQLLVSEFTKKKLRKSGGRQGPSQPYQLRIEHKTEAESGYELENNAQVEGASEIAAGEERYGYIGWKDDYDLWRMPVVGFGDVVADPEDPERRQRALHITVAAVPGVDMSLSLLRSDATVLLERRAQKGGAVAIHNFVPEVVADSYFIGLRAKRSNPEEMYVLKVEEVELGAGTEREPNDSLESATGLLGGSGALVLGRGHLSLGDVDMFSIAAEPQNRILEVQLKGPSDADLDLAVVAESGALLASVETETVGGVEVLRDVNVPANAAPIIRVLAKKLGEPGEYELSLTLVPGVAPPRPAPLGADAGPFTE